MAHAVVTAEKAEQVLGLPFHETPEGWHAIITASPTRALIHRDELRPVEQGFTGVNAALEGLNADGTKADPFEGMLLLFEVGPRDGLHMTAMIDEDVEVGRRLSKLVRDAVEVYDSRKEMRDNE